MSFWHTSFSSRLPTISLLMSIFQVNRWFTSFIPEVDLYRWIAQIITGWMPSHLPVMRYSELTEITVILLLVMWKPNFFHNRLSVCWFFTDNRNVSERSTVQAYAKSHVGITWWTTLHILCNCVERPMADSPTLKRVSRYLTVITIDCTIFYRFCSSQNKQSWTDMYCWVKKIQ